MVNQICRMLDLLFPRICLSCKRQWDYLCKNCKKNLKSYPEICPFCYKFSKDYNVCLDCNMNLRPDIKWLLIGFYYSDVLKKIILKLKYNHKRDVSNFLSERLALIVQIHPKLYMELEKWNLVICSVPSHWYRKYFVKWYNQSELLSKKLAKELWVEYCNIFKKNKHTKSQVWLDRKHRLCNLNSAFILRKNIDLEFLRWKTIIFVDDITTTWATIWELAKSLKAYNLDNNIYWLVIAKK